MKIYFAGLAGALALGLLAPVAEAAPLAGAGGTPPAASSEVIQVHGLHSSCRLDKFGWHRSYVWGRAPCGGGPRFHHHHHHHHKKHHHNHHDHHHHGKKKH